MQAYVLIQTEPQGRSLADELRALPDIVSAEDVTGAYDVIAVARSGSIRQLTEVVLAEIRSLPGVVRALPAPLLDGSGEERESGAPFRVSVASGQAA